MEHPIICCFLLVYAPRFIQGVMAANWKRLRKILGKFYKEMIYSEDYEAPEKLPRGAVDAPSLAVGGQVRWGL